MASAPLSGRKAAPTVAAFGVTTEVGKTWCGQVIVRALARRSLRVAPFKPLESGLELLPSGSSDAELLRDACGSSLPLEWIRPWPLPRPVAPAEELKRLGLSCTLTDLRAARDRLQREHDLIWFETAGGVLSPLLPGQSCADVAAGLEASALLIARDELGVISQVLTALESLERRRIPVLGVLLNRRGAGHPAHATNARILAEQAGVPIHTAPEAPELLDALTRLAGA